MLVISKKHRLAAKTAVSINELEKERWVLFERGASIRRSTDDFFKKVHVKPEKALESNDTYFVKLMVEHGLGVSLMPSWTVREEIKAGKLAQVGIKGHKLQRSVSMVSLKGSKSGPIRAFIEYILDQKPRLQAAASE